MGIGSENKSLNAEVTYNSTVVKGKSISIHNYKIVSFSGLPF